MKCACVAVVCFVLCLIDISIYRDLIVGYGMLRDVVATEI